MKILVTGGAGFIGSHLVDRLIKDNHEVVVVDNLSSGKKENLNKKANFIEGDIFNIDQFADQIGDVDIVFHVAAQVSVPYSKEHPILDAKDNILGTLAVIEFAKKQNVKKIIYSSSGGCIYGHATEFPTKEDAKPGLHSNYSISKFAADQYVKFCSIPSIVLRYSNVYGPRQSGSKEAGVIAIFTEQFKNGQALTIEGDGSQTRDWVHVSDVVEANIKAMNYEGTGVFNISTKHECSVKELAEIIGGEIVHKEGREGDVMRSCVDFSKAKDKLGWEPKITLKAGIKDLLQES